MRTWAAVPIVGVGIVALAVLDLRLALATALVLGWGTVLHLRRLRHIRSARSRVGRTPGARRMTAGVRASALGAGSSPALDGERQIGWVRHGYEAHVRDRMQHSMAPSSSGAPDVARMALDLAQVNLATGRLEESLGWGSIAAGGSSGGGAREPALLLAAEALIRAGKVGEGRELLIGADERSAEVQIRVANSLLAKGDAVSALDVYNSAWEAEGLTRLALADEGAEGGGSADARDVLARLRPDPSATARASRADGDRVTVLLPSFNAEATIATAVRSLVEQTYANLEIIVIDDASTDGTVAIVERWAATDPRITLIRQAENRGAYAARNAGLAVATGRWVRVHDADDYTHPDAIAAQVAPLAAGRAKWSAVLSIRVDAGLQAVSDDPNAAITWRRLRDCYPSYLMPREVLGDGWPELPVGSDWIVYDAVRRRLGERPEIVHPTVPLAFQLTGEGLTSRPGPTHLSSTWTPNGYRRFLHVAAKRYRKVAPDHFDAALAARPELRNPAEPVAVDTLLVFPFHATKGTWDDARTAILTLLDSRPDGVGRRIGILNLPDADDPTFRDMNPALIDLLRDRPDLRLVFAGQQVTAGSIVVLDPRSLHLLPDWLPDIAADRVSIVVPGRPAGPAAGTRRWRGAARRVPQQRAWSPLLVREGARRLAPGAEVELLAADAEARSQLSADPFLALQSHLLAADSWADRLTPQRSRQDG